MSAKRERRLNTRQLTQNNKTNFSKNNATKNNNTDLVEFAKVSDNVIAIMYKPENNRLKYTKEQISALIDNKNIYELRNVSRYFYSRRGLYKRLIQHMSSMLTYDYLVIPSKQTHEKIDTKNFKKYFNETINFIDSLYIKDTFSKIGELIFLNGAFYGYLREFGNQNAIQELPIDYCRTLNKADNGIYQVQFDLRYFDRIRKVEDRIKILNQFPEVFTQEYVEYIEGEKTGTEPWFIDLDTEYAMCFQFDDLGIPFFVGIFEDLVELEDYKSLEKTKTKMDLKKLLVQKLPMDEKTGEVLLDLPEAQALHENIVKMLQNNDNVDAISSPCEIDSLSLQDNSSKTNRDILLSAERTLFNDSGVSQVIFNSTGNLSLKVNINNNESISLKLLEMFKRWIDNKLDYNMEKTYYSFEIFFPPITIYNQKDKLDMYLKQATYGYNVLIPPVVSGVKQNTFINLNALEQNYYNLGFKLVPISSSHTQSSDKKNAGTPEKEETELTEEGLKTKDTGANESRA